MSCLPLHCKSWNLLWLPPCRSALLCCAMLCCAFLFVFLGCFVDNLYLVSLSCVLRSECRVLCSAKLFLAIFACVVPCCAMLCYAVACYVMPFHASLCCAVTYHAMQQYVMIVSCGALAPTIMGRSVVSCSVMTCRAILPCSNAWLCQAV